MKKRKLFLIRRDDITTVVYRTNHGTTCGRLPQMHFTMALCTKEQAFALAAQLEVIPKPVRGVHSMVSVSFGKQ
jgi:hypothetical protein